MKDEINIIVPDNYDMEADAQREIARMMRKEKAPEKPVYKYEKLDRYAGYGILFLSGALLLAAAIAILYHWPVWWLGG